MHHSMSSRSKIEVNPSLDQAAELLHYAFQNQLLALIAGECKVDYRGRASSFLDWGERLIIIKKDGSLLIHRPTGYEPVNWQPSGCLFHVKQLEDSLLIRAVRKSPHEVVDITVRSIKLAAALELLDHGAFSMHLTEEDMKKAILRNPSLIEEGFKPISEEKALPTGFVDIIGRDAHGNLVVVELKNETANREAVIQLYRYVSTLRKTNPSVRGIIAAPKIAKSARQLLESLKLEFKQLTPEMCSKYLRRSEEGLLRSFIEEYSH